MNENHKNHKLMWDELARTGGASKLMALRSLGLPFNIFGCFACLSVGHAGGDYGACEKCPIQWIAEPNFHAVCQVNKKSPFYRWKNAKTPRTRKEYAKIIANMKWRTKK